ncbi:hypothetical protein F4553_006150 [Allocatelliglobosispora scoriae]|uniref:Bulb-type lectin domain-containing protein n=1 Tax=Allocatelliglobosispora scoriae TaxID=643052 RepID=A0A841BYR7_9ACTN|nr:hypothetical protein [Allocatelliglobosispora scoriae]MBB5872716.1 hypothetical protein [Allocatelliglobosispora scoriae]
MAMDSAADGDDEPSDELEIIPAPAALAPALPAGRHRLTPPSQELALVESWTGEIIELEDPPSKANTRVIIGATVAVTVVLAAGLTIRAGGGPSWSQPASSPSPTPVQWQPGPVIEAAAAASPVRSGPPSPTVRVSSPTATPTATPQTLGGSPAVPSASASPSPGPSPSPVWTASTFTPTLVLDEGDSVSSNRTRLLLQNNGDLVVVDENGTIRWRSGTDGRGERAVFQGDGHLVVYDRRDRAVWASGTAGHSGAVLVLAADGDVRIVDGGTVLWSAGTAH